MADPSPAPTESPAQTKARLRRERLAAKSGASRLQQITALQGGPPKELRERQATVPAVSPQVAASSSAASASASASAMSTPDPDEIDISQHHYTPPPAAQFRQPSPSPDPAMAMLQQLMGAGPSPGGMPSLFGADGASAALPGILPPGLADMFSAMQDGSAAGAGTVAVEPLPDHASAWLWRLIHAVFSLGLAMYIVLQTPFTGSKSARDSLLDDDNWTVQSTSEQSFAHFFYLFATLEVGLQSSRYFIEKGQLQGSGILSTVAGILPPPYSAYLRTIGRYSVIYSTVVSDAMVIVFVLGASTWWQGAAVA